MTNPLLQLYTKEYELVDFQSLKDEHYLPAFEHAVAEHNREIARITSQPEVTFENTLVALEKSGQLLTQMMLTFYNKSASDTNEEIQKLEAVIFPKFSAHLDSINLNPELFQRLLKLEGLLKSGELKLDDESSWLVTKYLQDFRHAVPNSQRAQGRGLLQSMSASLVFRLSLISDFWQTATIWL